MKKRWWLLLAILLVAALGSVIYYLWWSKSVKPYAVFKGNGYSFSYAKQIKAHSLTEADKQGRLTFKASEPINERPFLITAGYDDGLKAAAQSAHTTTYEIMLAGLKNILPKRYPAFKQQSFRTLVIDGKQAAEVMFTYTNNKVLVKEKLMAVMKDDDRIVNIAVQSHADAFDQLSKKYFDHVFQSLRF